MSVHITGRVFWTTYPGLTYTEKSGRPVTVAETSAKITMLAIGDSADDFGENSYNSFETLATKTGLERRSVIRVTRALILHNYLAVQGLSIYGTNNFKINLEKLGELPKRRATVGRPKGEKPETSDSVTKTSDSVTKTSDSVTKTSDLESPDPSLSVLDPKHGAQTAPASASQAPQRRTAANIKGDVMDGILAGAAGNSMDSKIRDFPEDIQDTLRVLVQLFGWPSVPARPGKSAKGGEYALWIQDLREINRIIAGHGRRALEATHAKWSENKFTVAHPGALTKTVFAVVSELNQRATRTETRIVTETPLMIHLRNFKPRQSTTQH